MRRRRKARGSVTHNRAHAAARRGPGLSITQSAAGVPRQRAATGRRFTSAGAAADSSPEVPGAADAPEPCPRCPSRRFAGSSPQTRQAIAITSALALACAAALVVYDIATYRQALTRDLEALADLVGDNSTASLAFGDGAAARETLQSLPARPTSRRRRSTRAIGHRARRLHAAPARRRRPRSTAAETPRRRPRDFAVVRACALDGQPVGRRLRPLAT